MITIPEIQQRYTREMAIAILVCRVYLHKASASDLADYLTASGDIDWHLFERIITAHQIRPVIYKVLSAQHTKVDTVFLETLRNNCLRIATDNLKKSEELIRINKLFKNSGIKSVPYKGVILSQALFGDFISRETADIDFLLEPVSFSKAREILINDGYTPRYYNPDFEKQILHTSHELQFSKTTPNGIIKIELHWAATNNMMCIPLPNTDVLQDLQTITLPGGSIDTFNLQNHLLVLLVHHGVNDVWRTLRHSLDIALFIEKYRAVTDWGAVQKAAGKYKIAHTTEVGMLVAHQLFGIEIPLPYYANKPLPDKIMDNLLRFPAIKKRKLTFENLGQQLFLRDSFTDKLQLLLAYIRTGVTPNVRDMEAWPLSKKWFVLYYFIKPFRILIKNKNK